MLVFVHGFKGSATDTWISFPDIINHDPKFKKVDAVFYGYKSLKGQAFDQAREMYVFLDSYLTKPSYQIRSKTIPAYKKILIVAHSLGAVVSRFALIEAIKDNKPWRKKCNLVLFAPAHNGARPLGIILAVLPGISKVLGGLGLFFKPITDDLRPGSTALTLLKETTLSYKNTTEAAILKANVAEAKGDLVVHNGRFCFDKYLDGSPILNTSHVDVCKPKLRKYETPLDHIKKLV